MLVDESNKALILKLDRPGEVLEAIPSARLLNFKGSDLTVVPHRFDEVRVLRNLGINAPSPILHDYNWPGRYTPYEHQKLTSAFLTMHKKALVLNDIGCVDSETEYLSPTGWKRIADYDTGMVAQYDPDTGRAEFVTPTEFVKKPCSNMIRFKTKHGVDQLLSPEHRVLYVGSTNKVHVTTAAEVLSSHNESIYGWKGRIITTFSTAGGPGIPLSEEHLRLQIAVIADGHFSRGSKTNLCVVRLKRQRKKDRLRNLLNQSGIEYKEREQNVPSAKGFTVFRFYAPMRVKEFGAWAWDASSDQLRIIADEVSNWDGSERKSGGSVFFSRVKESADFIQYAYAATGRTASLLTTNRESGIDYVVHARNKAALLNVCGSNGTTKTNTVYEEPSTDGYKYCFMVPSTFLLLRRNGCVFATGNTGKTHSVLWAADYLMSIGEVKKVLVLSPLSTLERVWADGVYTSFTKRKSVTLHGTAERRLKLLATDADIKIVNHDGFSIIADKAHGMFDLVVVDEAAVMRNPNTTRFKTLRKFMADERNSHVRLWLLTGTPTPNEPTDAWALAKLVDSPTLTSTYTGFRDKVMMKVGQWKFLPRPNSAELVTQVLQPAIRFMRDECLDLPDTVFHTRDVKLTKEQSEAYKEMVKHLVAEANSGQITAANEAVKMQKLVQIACGVAYDNFGKPLELDCKPRVDLVKEIINEVGGKVIIFLPLTGALHMLNRELAKDYSTAVVNGAVPARERNRIFTEFQNDPDPRILVAHPACMSHGVTLTASSTIIWYGPITSNEQYTQANGRIERIGKKHTSNVFHIEATDLERKVFERLRGKQKLQGLLLDLIGGM